MLRVPALQVRDPISLPVLMEPYNLLFSHTALSPDSYGSPNVNKEDPAATATNCFPPTA
jgi:hypothetical protein